MKCYKCGKEFNSILGFQQFCSKKCEDKFNLTHENVYDNCVFIEGERIEIKNPKVLKTPRQPKAIKEIKDVNTNQKRVAVDENEIIRLFTEEHISISSIGKQLGVSKGTIKRRLIANNIELNIVKVCPICNTEFTPHNGMQEYCSKDCTRIAKNNNRNKFTREELEAETSRKCLICGTEFEVNSKTMTKKYCSDLCCGRAEKVFGDKLERDKQYRYEINFGGNREKVLLRDNYECQMCGNKSKLVVHHKDFSGNTNGSVLDQDNVNNDMDNLVTLCRRCHINTHRIMGKL